MSSFHFVSKIVLLLLAKRFHRANEILYEWTIYVVRTNFAVARITGAKIE